MGEVRGGFTFNDATVLGKTAIPADVVIDYCNTLSGVAVTGTPTIVEQGVGDYVMVHPNITERTMLRGHLASDATKRFVVMLDPVDGDIAKESSLALVATYIDTEITAILDRIGAFTGTGVNTILGFFKALLKKDAAIPSDIGGTFDPATDSTEALAESLAAGVTVNPAQFGAGVLQGKVAVTNGETIRRTRGNFIPQGTITFAFGTDWDCTGRDVYFCVKATAAGYTGPKLLDLLCVLTDAATGTGTLPDMNLDNVLLPASDDYTYEFQSVLPDGTKPLTPRRGRFILDKDWRR